MHGNKNKKMGFFVTAAANHNSEIAEGTGKKPRILFICTHNSARSQIAEGYMNAKYGDRFETFSAGTEITRVHPMAIAVMKEIGIDISAHRSKLIDEHFGKGIGTVITVCDSAHASCPFFPGAKTVLHVDFPDPSTCTGTPDECLLQFREVRDAIILWIDAILVPEYGKERTVSLKQVDSLNVNKTLP
jgi:arsenate reductase